MFLAWGPERVWLYNDAFVPILGDKHPKALGRPSRKVWAEIWPQVEPMFAEVFAGRPVQMNDLALRLNRGGRPEEASFSFSYNPAVDENGEVAGLFGVCIETTSHVRSIRAAREAEARLQLALSAGEGIGTWDWDVREDRVFADERFAKFYGVDADNAKRGAPLAAFLSGVHPEDVPKVQAAIETALETCGAFSAEYRLRGSGESTRWVSAQGQCLPGQDGRAARLTGAVFDISARKTDELRRAALVSLTDRIRDIDDPDELAYRAAEILGRALNVSRAGYGLIDVATETITIERDWNAPGVKTLAGTLHFRDYGSYIEDLARGETVVFEDAELDPRTADTAEALKAISAQAVVNMPVTEHGGLVALLYLNHKTARPWPPEDLALIREFAARTRTATERLRITAELRESEARFRNVADHSPLMMWVTNARGYCTYLNRSWYEFTGQSEAQAEGFGWLDAVHPDDKQRSEEVFLHANERRESFKLEYRLRGRDGAYRWAIDAASPRFGSNGEFLGYVGSVLDIDERKRDETLRQIRSRLLELAIKDTPLEQVLEELVLTVESYAAADALGAVMLVEEDGRLLRRGAAPRLADAVFGADGALDAGVVGALIRKDPRRKKPEAAAADLATDPRWKAFRPLSAKHGLRAGWAAPVHSAEGDLLAVFMLFFRAPHELSPDELAVAEFALHTASLVIERKKAHEALRDETRMLESLSDTAAALAGELELERLVQRITDAGVRLTGAKFGAFFHNIEHLDGQRYMLYTLSGVERSAFSQFPMPRKTELFAPTFEGAGVTRSHDILTDPRYGKNAPYQGMPKGHLPVRSYLAVPVVSREGTVEGALFFGHPEPGRFTDRHERLMEGLRGHAAIAIDNARLYQAAQSEIEQRTAAEAALQQLNDDLETRVAEQIEERRQAEAALQQSQRMEAIGQLTGGVAHDFNNLLQVISGNLNLLMQDVAGDERAEQRVRNALNGVSRGAKLASQLLAFGRRQPLEPKVINIGRLVSGLDDMLRRTLGEEVQIETTIAAGLWNTLADPSQVENALLNLAINARDAMGGAGRLTIEVGNASLDDEFVRTNADLRAGQYVLLAVTDTGPGIPPEIIERVFEPFFTTKPEGRGTGLGLSMVYGFAKQSNGHVKIASQVGRGTTIKLYLPRVDQAEERIVEIERTPVAGGSETILVVEDEDEVRAAVIDMLRELGYSVLSAPTPDSAIAIIESGAQIDLLFTDVVMPGALRSPELARRAKERLPDLAVLFTSGYAEDAIVHGGRLDEGVQLLSKPYSREALAKKIRHVLGGAERNDEVGATAPSAAAGNGVVPAAGPPSGEGLKVLFVEDDVIIRLDTIDLLEGLGHSVIEAGSAEQAETMLPDAEFDVLMTDVKLPGKSGVELADKVRETRPEVDVVFCTGNSRLPDHERQIEMGARLLTKPYDSKRIEECLRSLKGRSHGR